MYHIRFICISELLSDAADRSAFPGRITKVLNKYAAYKVLVLDEWLIQYLSNTDIGFLFELSERQILPQRISAHYTNGDLYNGLAVKLIPSRLMNGKTTMFPGLKLGMLTCANFIIVHKSEWI